MVGVTQYTNDISPHEWRYGASYRKWYYQSNLNLAQLENIRDANLSSAEAISLRKVNFFAELDPSHAVVLDKSSRSLGIASEWKL